MPHAARWAAKLALVTIIAPALSAQDLAKVCQGLGQVTAGQWASYDVTGEMESATLRLAVVDSERRGSRTLYWLEVDHASRDSARNAVVQLLVQGLGTESTTVHGLIMKLAGQPAMRMPDQMVAAMGQRMAENPALGEARRCATAQVVGWETVTVPAGAIHALHVKDADGEAWLAPDVKPTGLVKLQPRQGGGLALTGHGSDAKSSISEPPQTIPGLGQP